MGNFVWAFRSIYWETNLFSKGANKRVPKTYISLGTYLIT